jgi:hypothetical protein
MKRMIAALQRFEDSPVGVAFIVAFLFALLWAGLTITGVQ